MSKSSTATAQKFPPQLSSKSAWSKGPPQPPATTASSRSQSPAPTPTTPNAPSNIIHGTHSRRPSTLGQGVPIKEGVSVPRNIAATKSGSAVTFGSIDDATAPISASPAAAPAAKPAEVKSFGSVAVQNGASVATSKAVSANRTSSSSPAAPSSASATSTPHTPAHKIDRKDILKMFQGASAPSPAPQPSADSTSSPANRPTSLPPAAHQPGGSYIPPTFQAGGSNLRPQPQNGSPSGAPPRSPSYSRPAMANGQGGNVNSRPPNAPTSAPGAMPAAMPSPRMTPHPPPGQPTNMPPPQVVPWGPGYYYPQYPGMPPEGAYPYPPAWAMAQQMQPHHPPHPGGPVAPAPGMPMSPRNAPPSLQPAPGTPTLSHATPVQSHVAPPHIPPPSVTSPPPTPSAANGSSAARLNSSASAFVPKKSAAISLKTSDGREVDLGTLRRSGQSPVSGPGGSSPIVVKAEAKRVSIRMESQEQKEKRMAAEEAEKARVEREAKEALEAKERAEREKREAAERKVREEKERKEREEREERERKEAEERERKEAEEREKAEAERKRKEEEEAAERARAEEERKRKEEEEVREKARLEEERIKKEVEERERKAREEEELKLAAEKAAAEAKAKANAEEKEEGEIVEETPAPAPAPAAGKDGLRIDTSTSERRRPGPLDLKNVHGPITPGLPSALATARAIEDLGSVTYPDGIKSPKVELNVNAAKGKFKYDRDFLMQFMMICKDKPDNLPALDAIGLEPSDQTFGMTRTNSQRNRVSSLQSPAGGRAPVGLGFVPSSLSKTTTSFAMGNFSTTPSRLSSEERFANSNRSASSSGMPGPSAVPGRPTSMVRTSSQGGQGGQGDRRRTRSSRGHVRDPQRQASAANHPSQAPTNMTPPLEPVAPLEQTANRWVASSTKRNVGPDGDSPEVVDRKVKALLNKLTMERFDPISDQIITWANKSEKEKNGQTLIQVIKLVFEKATDEATFSEMYARLCRKMMEQISTGVSDDTILNAEGKPFAGGQLFRKYLLNRCQEDFERGWNQKETTAAAAAAAKATEDQAVKEANQKDKEDGKADEVQLYSDEYYAAAKAKRRGLGLIRFIGELFKLQMLTERIMHECIKKLLGNVENPEEEEIESLCKLLTTVGQLLDTPKARAHMDVYFGRMKELTKSKNVNSRMTFMLLDVIELREHRWIPRNQIAAPTTIAQIHEAAAKDRAQAEKDAANLRQSTMSRGGSRRGGERGDFQAPNADGWSVAGSANAPRPPAKVGDLSNFGKISKASPMTMGPSSVFAKGKDGKSREASVSRTASSRNMFDMLNNDMAAEPPAGKSSRPPSRKPSADFSQTGIPEAPQTRKRLQLLPRSRPVEEAKPEAGDDEEEEEEAEADTEESTGPTLTEDEAKRKIDEDIKELFSLRILQEAESYFTSLPADYRWILVDKLVNKGIDGKADDIPLVANVLRRARDKELVSADSLERGFESLAEIIDDIAIDVPKAFNNMAEWMKAAGFGADEERRTRILSKVQGDSERLLTLITQ